jgi:hypothetical protein
MDHCSSGSSVLGIFFGGFQGSQRIYKVCGGSSDGNRGMLI